MLVYLSVEKHFSLVKVYSVESMREETLFPGERVYMFFQLRSIFPSGRFTVWSLWGKELFSPVRECTMFTFHACVSFSWESFFPRKDLQCESMREGTLFPGERVHVLSVEKHFSLWKVYSVESMREGTLFLVRECTMFTFHACVSLSWESFFSWKGLQCGVYEGRNSIPWWEGVHVLSVEKYFSIWKAYSVESLSEGTLFPGERVYMFFQLRSIFPFGMFTVWSLWGKELYSTVRESVHVLSIEKYFSLWKVYSVESMREGTLFPGERECTCSFSWDVFFPLEGLQCEDYEGRN